MDSKCGTCDNCMIGGEYLLRNVSTEARKILRVVNELFTINKNGIGITKLSAILSGNLRGRLDKQRWGNFKLLGCGQERNSPWWRCLIELIWLPMHRVFA